MDLSFTDANQLKVTIDNADDLLSGNKIQIYNMIGQLLISKDINEFHDNVVLVDLSALNSNDILLVRIFNEENGLNVSKRILPLIK